LVSLLASPLRRALVPEMELELELELELERVGRYRHG
jgi:hypothetical protein